MIKSIEIGNINSIKHAVLEFDKAKYKFNEEFILNNKVANPIAFYGRNGSGKSSFLLAVYYLVSFLISEVDDLAPFIPNLSDQKSIKDRSSIEITMELEGHVYVYGLQTEFNGIKKEYLKKDNTNVFIRSDKEYEFRNRKEAIKSPLFPALRLLASERVDETDICRIFDYLSNIVFISADNKRYLAKSMQNIGERDVMVNKSSEVRKILEQYGSFPVYDVFSKQTETGRKNYYVTIEKDQGSFSIPYDLISSGMRNQSFLLSALLDMPDNGVLIVDELEDALHPLTIINFLKYALKRNIQLIFTSHNTNILTYLRPDNIVFANWKNGESNYKRLSDIYPNIREVNNIEKMYLNSTFDEEIEKEVK